MSLSKPTVRLPMKRVNRNVPRGTHLLLPQQAQLAVKHSNEVLSRRLHETSHQVIRPVVKPHYYLEDILSKASVQQSELFHCRKPRLAQSRRPIAWNSSAFSQQAQLFLCSELFLSGAPSVTPFLVAPELDRPYYATYHLTSPVTREAHSFYEIAGGFQIRSDCSSTSSPCAFDWNSAFSFLQLI